MMRKEAFVIIVFSIVALGSCVKVDVKPEVESEREYLVFGTYFGECKGKDCVRLYLIKDGKLYEDTLDQYPEKAAAANLSTLERSDEAYKTARPLLSSFPRRLLNEQDTVYGQPDAGDWGGVYLEIFENGQRRWWLLDHRVESNPEFLRPYVMELIATVQNLN